MPRWVAILETLGSLRLPSARSVRLRCKCAVLSEFIVGQVDYAAGIASRYYSSAGNELSGQVQKQKDYHRENLERYKAAREAYLQKIEDTVGFVKQHGVAGTAKYSADAVLAQVEEAKKIPAFLEKQGSFLANKVNEAWSQFYSLPAGKISTISYLHLLLLFSCLVHQLYLVSKQRLQLPWP